MNYPNFFDEVRTIRMTDPLSAVLGTFENGDIEFSYLDVVKAAGHSCPTVGGAYLMTLKALEALYGSDIPVRGNIRVAFKEDLEEGVAGVIGNVVSHITGATDKSGFKGLGGTFARHSLMDYGRAIESSARFTRVDNGACVDVFYDSDAVGGNPKQKVLMQKITKGLATAGEKEEFGRFWQDRVRSILIDHIDNDEMIRVQAHRG